MAFVRSALALFAAVSLGTMSARGEEKRLALIISNQEYSPSVGRLHNTHIDGHTMAMALEDVGFSVNHKRDLNSAGMKAALDTFHRAILDEQADGDEVVAFFYASMHGMAAEDGRRIRNFLIPTDVDLSRPGDLVSRSLALDQVVATLSMARTKASIIVSDACRNSIGGASVLESDSKGITRIIDGISGFTSETVGSNMLVAYATQLGQTTPDDGKFANILSRQIRAREKRANYAIVDALSTVGNERDWDGKPFSIGGLPPGLCFAECPRPQVDLDTMLRSANTARVNAAAFSPDSKTIATAGEDKIIWLWDVRTGTPLRSLEGHAASVESVSYSPDGRKLLSASEDGTVRVWDSHTGKMIWSGEGHERRITAASFSSDGLRVLTTAGRDAPRLWDALTGRLVATLPHEAGMVDAAFTPDGARVLSLAGTAASDRKFRLWDAKTGAPLSDHDVDEWADTVVFAPSGEGFLTLWHSEVQLRSLPATEMQHELKAHDDAINTVFYSTDGTRVVTSSWNSVHVWDAVSGAKTASMTGHEDTIWSARFSSDGARVVTSSTDGTARIWASDSGEQLATIKVGSEVFDAAFSQDGEFLVTLSSDRRVRLWNGQSGFRIATLGKHTEAITSARLSPDQAKIITASWDGSARIWDSTTGAAEEWYLGKWSLIVDAVFGPDGQSVVAVSMDGTVHVWDRRTGREMMQLSGPVEDPQATIAYSVDGNRLTISSRKEDNVRLYDATAGKLIATLPSRAGVFESVFSPDGSVLVMVGPDSEFWNARDGTPLPYPKALPDSLKSVSFSPDGTRFVATGGFLERGAGVWDVRDQKRVYELIGHTDQVLSASFSADGKKILTTSSDRTARVWDAVSGKELARLTGHEDLVTSAHFSPDESLIVTGSWDRTARLWDALSGRELFVLAGHTDAVTATFFDDGERILTYSSDGTSRIWRIRQP